eukprot:GILK01001913.1.p1 GENE.GILK01001913.1~~GILK01001913.1.p1  ORF type:complete len:909 (-),score=261.49 GILK01001913.1:118-2775(-)
MSASNGNDDNDHDFHNDDDYDEEGEFPFLEADHPLLAPVQAALAEQLKRHQERVKLKLREKEEQLRVVKKTHEVIGVDLYGVQQQLAKMQMGLERTHDNFNIIQKQRYDAEERMKVATAQYDHRKKEVEEMGKKVTKAQDELNALNRTLRQVEEYNDQMKSEIAVTRRATYRAEESVSTLEKEKKLQDLLIDSMNEDIKRLQEQKALYEAQLISQKQETEAAARTLAEAAKEMEAINFEKKQLLQQWQSSLIGMQRRDEALQATQDALREQKELEQALEAEMRGFKESIKKEQDKNERLVGFLTKNQSETQYLEGQIDLVKVTRERLGEQYAMLKKSLDQTNTERQRIETERSTIEDQMTVIDKNIQKISREAQRLSEDIMNNLSDQTTIQKSAANMNKQTRKLHAELSEKEGQVQQLDNEIARLRVDALNTEAQNEFLKDNLRVLAKDLKERETLIDKYEMEIRQRNDQIEKKQHYVDRLNRKFDELTHNMEDENTGPLEATIKNVNKQIAEKEEQCQAMQRDWIKKQTQLVAYQHDIGKQAEVVQDLNTKKTLLTTKKIRLNGSFASVEKEIKELRNATRGMRIEMTKLNDLIAKHSNLKQVLGNENFNLETEFVEKLKDLEKDSVTIEGRIQDIKQEKAAILGEIVESERQIMLWERKIQLEKEMQDALDPNVGQSEVQEMKKEIHRMELRFDQLKRKQESMISEMERAIDKRETIALKYVPKDTTAAGKAGTAKVTQAQVQRQIESLKSTLKHTTSNAQQLDQTIRQRVDELNQIGEEIQKTGQSQAKLDQIVMELQLSITVAKILKQRNLANLLRYQKSAKKYDQLAEGKYRVSVRGDAVQNMLEQQEAETDKLREVLDELRTVTPHLQKALDTVYEWVS